MEINNLLSVTDRVIKEYENSLIKMNMLEEDIQENEEAFRTLMEKITLYEEVRVFLQQLAEAARKEVAAGLENIVTLCLQSVFGPDMSFEIDIETSRNNTVIEFYIVNTEGETAVRSTIEDSYGGGVVDTASIGLRYGLLRVLNPEPIGPILLDEPAKMVSADRIRSIGALIQELNRLFQKQSIMVTHHEPLMDMVENAVYFEKINGVTVTS